MSRRWEAMRVPPKGSGKRRSTAVAAAAALRAAVRVNNRAISGGMRPSRSGISNHSVFQPGSSRPELKFLDVTTNVTPVLAGTGSITLLNGCAQGNDADQHIGRTTRMRSLYWLWEGAVAPTTTGQGSMRLIILYDKEAEGAAPTIASGAQTDAFNQDDIVAQMNLNNRDRFVTLLDEVVECIGTAGPQSFFRKGYRNIDLPCVFNGSAASTIAAINTGSVYAFQWNSGVFGVAGAPTVLQTRIRFEDN